MSYTETHIGKLKKVETGIDTEQWCKEYCCREGFDKLATYNDNWIEQFKDHFYDKFLVTENVVYEKFDHIEVDESDVYHMQKNPDGTYTFVMQFYNGGTCLDECLEEGLQKLQDDN